MKLLVTGASGFLGAYVVAQALRRGHSVRAMLRPVADISGMPWANHPNLERVFADLRSPRGLVEALNDVDAVLHLAAAKSGDFYTQFRGTVNATENLIAAMRQAGVSRLIAISTFSVYDYLHPRSGKLLDENARLERKPAQRDEYARTKLLQEQLVREFAEQQGGKVTILRPGVIFGRNNLWTARLGANPSERRWIRIGANARLPLVYVENCAEAIVIAAEKSEAIGQTINLVDDETPTQRRYMAELTQRMKKAPAVIPVNWTLMRLVARMAHVCNRLLFGNRAKLPGILVPARLHARCKPLRYSNARMKKVLDYQPHYTLQIALDRSFSDLRLPQVQQLSTSAVANTADSPVQEASGPCASPI